MDIMTDNSPARLWYFVIGEYVGPIKITPMFMLHSINASRLNDETLNVMISVVEVSRAINRIMGRNENFGV